MPTELPHQSDPHLPEEPGQGGPYSAPGGGEHTPRPTPERPAGGQPAADGGSLNLGSVAGIPIRLHVTFLLLLAWLWFVGLGAKNEPSWTGPLFVAALFGCVLLHELSHALVARRYGLRTRAITLYPIGGIASMETPPRPRQELWIALAGPLANVLIAAILYAGLRLAHHPIRAFRFTGEGTDFAVDLLWGNVTLAVFNLLPAFPMDGGRVLRALIARVTDEASATAIAARIGQVLAFGIGLLGLWAGNFLLIIVAVFVYFGAGQEAAIFQTRVLMTGHRVQEAMLREFHTLPVGSTLQEASEALLAGSQQDFPIVHGDEVVGVLSRSALMRGLASEGPSSYVAGVMERDFSYVRPEDDLETALEQIQQAGPILVMEPDAQGRSRLVGMLTQENLLEFLTLTQLKMRRSARP